MQDQQEKELNPEAMLMLLRVIELNGGRVHRGAIQKALSNLHFGGEIEEKFTPESPKNYTEYDFVLTSKGQDALASVKNKKVKQLEVTVVKEKKGRATVLEYKNNNYILQPQQVNKSKNWAGQNFPDSKY